MSDPTEHIPLKLGPKAQMRKDSWIRETQLFQKIAYPNQPADSYDVMSAEYDQAQRDLVAKKIARKHKPPTT